MTFSQKLGYFFLSLTGLIALAFLEFFVLKDLLDIFSTNWIIHTVVFVIMVLLINPLLVYYLVGLIPFTRKKSTKNKKKEVKSK